MLGAIARNPGRHNLAPLGNQRFEGLDIIKFDILDLFRAKPTNFLGEKCSFLHNFLSLLNLVVPLKWNIVIRMHGGFHTRRIFPPLGFP